MYVLCEGGMHLFMAGFSSIGYLRGKVGLRELSFESNASAVGLVLIYSCLEKSVTKLYFAMWFCYYSMPLIHRAVGWSAVCDCGIPHHTHLLLKLTFSIEVRLSTSLLFFCSFFLIDCCNDA